MQHLHVHKKLSHCTAGPLGQVLGWQSSNCGPPTALQSANGSASGAPALVLLPVALRNERAGVDAPGAVTAERRQGDFCWLGSRLETYFYPPPMKS